MDCDIKALKDSIRKARKTYKSLERYIKIKEHIDDFYDNHSIDDNLLFKRLTHHKKEIECFKLITIPFIITIVLSIWLFFSTYVVIDVVVHEQFNVFMSSYNDAISALDNADYLDDIEKNEFEKQFTDIKTNTMVRLSASLVIIIVLLIVIVFLLKLILKSIYDIKQRTFNEMEYEIDKITNILNSKFGQSNCDVFLSLENGEHQHKYKLIKSIKK